MLRLLKAWFGAAPIPDSGLTAGWQALESQDLATAESIARRFTTDSPNIIEASRLLAQARARQGYLEDAQHILKSVLEIEWDDQASRELVALHLARGQFEEASGWFEAIIARRPMKVSAHLGLATLLDAAGRSQEVLRTLDPVMQKIGVEPHLALEAYELLLRSGHADEARALLNRVSQLPNCPARLLQIQLEFVAQSRGELNAIKLGLEYIAIFPGDAGLRTALAKIFLKAGDMDAASEMAELAARLAPEDVAVLSVCAEIQKGAGKIEMAKDELELAIHFQPANVSTWIQLVRLLIDARATQSAVDASSRFVVAHPARAEAWFWQGKTSELCDRVDDAITAYERSVAIDPDWAPSLTNLGLLCIEQGAVSEALVHLKRVLALQPEDADAHLNLGMAYRFAADVDAALKHMTTALRLSPDDPITLYQLSTLKLATGDFSTGWLNYDARWLQPHSPRRLVGGPAWTGDPLPAHRVLLWGEQGLGDQVMFASCLEDAAQLVGKCIVACNPRLVSLFQRSFPTCEVVATSEGSNFNESGIANFDAQAPLGDLPGFFRKSHAAFPAHRGYLKVEPSSAQHWRDKLSELPGRLKVGISWVGGVRQTGKARRSHQLLSWAPILSNESASFVSLQYTPCSEELADVTTSLGVPIAHWQDAIDDLDQTAALMSELDLVISVCNTVVHLAGALDVPVWVMTPLAPEWRYMTGGSSLPWYPSATLLRQVEPNQWANVISEVAARLASLPQVARPRVG